MSNQIWDQILRDTTAKDIAVKDPLKTEPDKPLKEALRIMKEKRILSMPVVEGNDMLRGFVDVLDVSAYALKLWRDHVRNEVGKKPSEQQSKFSQSSLSEKFFSTPVRELINYSGNDELIEIHQDAPLRDVFRLLSAHRFSSHRVAVTDQGKLLGIITQCDILKFVDKQFKTKDLILGNMSLEDLNLVNTCLMVRADRPFIDCLSLLVDAKVSGLALVDWEGKLLANLSASDLKGMVPDAFDMFWKPTIDFLRQGTDTKSSIPPYSCNPNAKLKNVTDSMISSGIHRMFITKENGQLEGICSLNDLIGLFSEGIQLPREGYQG